MSAPISQPPIANRLSGQVAIITGAAGNIGLETASRFLQEGAKVALVDISAEGLKSALATLSTKLPQGKAPESCICCIQADVTSEADVKRYVEETVRVFGRLDTAFLCAGISYASTSIFDTTEETYDRVMRINGKSGKLLR
jgi:NAD(P)-dependent dehydrogenase (short-subunit alcohol dehydrogenase family)